MQENKEKSLQELYADAKDYIDTRLNYTKLFVVEKAAQLFADILTNAVVVVCFVLAFLFGTFTLAFYLADVLGSLTRGFGCVSILYLAVALIVFFTKDKFIEKRIVDAAIRKYFEKVAEKEESNEEL